MVDQPAEVRAGEHIKLDQLNSFLAEAGAGVPAILEIRQFPGGYSNLTYLLRSENGEYVLRRPPMGAAIKSAHDMGREFKVLSLLHKHYSKVPRPVYLCTDENPLGAPFYLMERLKGIILRPSDVKQIRIDPAEMRKISEALVDNLVDLHNLDVVQTGLDQLGKPDGYVKRQVEGWSKRYRDAETEAIEGMDSTSQWLGSNLPEETAVTLLHNDYKYDNVILNPDKITEIIGVLDWEMATVGDPWMDLGASLAYWAERGDSELAKVFNVSWLPGNLTRREVFDRYCDRSGRTTRNIGFYYAFGMFKNAVIAQQIYRRWKHGHTTDARFGTLIHVIRDLALRASEVIGTGTL